MISDIISIICLVISIINLVILFSVSNFLVRFAASMNDPEFNIANKEDSGENKENPNNEKGLIDV